MAIRDMLGNAGGFIFGGNTDVPTAEALKKRREMAEMLAARSAMNTPKNLGEGLASIGSALAYRYLDKKIGGQEDEERKRIADAIAGIGGFSGGFSGGSYGGPIAGAAGGFTGAGGAPVAPTPSNPNISPMDTGNPIYQGLIERGLPEPVAQGFMMNFADESGLNPGINEQNPVVPGSRGGFGLAQWTGPRRVALEQFAQQTGRPVDDPNVQLDFLMTELQGSEAGAASKFMGATDPGQAAAGIATHFLRPAQEHLDRRVAEYTGGGGMDMLAGMMGGREPDMGRVAQIAELLSNPYADDGQKIVMQALLEREMDAGDPIDPLGMARLGLDQQRLELERQKAARPDPIRARSGDVFLDPNTLQPMGGVPGEQGFRPATPEEAAQYGAPAGQIGPDNRFYPINPPSGMSVESDGAGGIRIVQGPGASGRGAFTEGQSKDNVFSTRARGALPLVDQYGGALTSRGDQALGAIPLGLGRGAQNTDYQLAEQAGEEFLTAILRKDTGAAITREEQAIYGNTYLPRPGDSPELLQQKQQARLRAVEAIEAGMSPAQILAQEQALANSEPAGAIPQSAIDAGIDPDLWQYMSPEDRALWQN